MKSIVDKLSSRIDAIEQSGTTSGGNGQSGEVKEHTHTVDHITDLDTKLSGYALSSHTHTVDHITDLDTSTFATKEPNIFYKDSCKIVDDTITIPICKADSKCFQCNVLIIYDGQMFFNIETIYIGNHQQFGYISLYEFNDLVSKPFFDLSLIKATSSDEEIICIRMKWNTKGTWFGGNVPYLIISNQEISSNDIEIQSEEELPKYEMRSDIRKLCIENIKESSSITIPTTGAVKNYVDTRVEEILLEKGVIQ